ncbi:hypothetical protein [Actinoplanes lobatus]|uniref:Uncharacterized protein n=1 Tax=Actinoplanes lobatus TaxID=113568 RepID=A0A7W7MM14_9ACTN|nr:hypothetical protein [Actinoplanes lobatus]MBB4755344.1 hypothetical protein [Actinoplanes lobatus]GIE46402.1 hypothetical protein Alo02nite_93000 [Actinoplanes lobatus]
MPGTGHLPPGQRKLIASIAANTRFAGMTADDRRAATAPAREARKKSWERKADPEGRMTPDELADAVVRLKKAHYARMQLASAQARTGRKAA